MPFFEAWHFYIAANNIASDSLSYLPVTVLVRDDDGPAKNENAINVTKCNVNIK